MNYLLVIGLAACGSGGNRGGSLQKPVTASPELAKLPVLIRLGTVDDCAKRGGAELMASEVKRELVSAGMNVVSSEQDPHELVAELSFLVTDCHTKLHDSFEGTINLTFRGEGRSIHQEEYTEKQERGFFNKERSTFVEPAQFMVRRALSSMPLNQFALAVAERGSRRKTR